MSHIPRRTSCSGMPAAAATCTRTSGETEGVSSEARVHLREFSSEARRKIISTSAGLRRFSLPSIWGVILQLLEPLISLGGDREDPRGILQIRPAREYGKHHGHEHHPPSDLGDDALPTGGPWLAQKEYENGDALGGHLRLAPPVRGDDLPGLQGDHPEPSHGELPDNHDRGHPRGHGALPHEGEEERDDEGLVGYGVHQLAEARYLVVAAGDDPVEVVGQNRGRVQDDSDGTSPLEGQIQRDQHGHYGDQPDQGELVSEAQSTPVSHTLSPASSPPLATFNVAPLGPRLKGSRYSSWEPLIWVTAGRRNRPKIQSAAIRTLLCGLFRRTR